MSILYKLKLIGKVLDTNPEARRAEGFSELGLDALSNMHNA